MYYTTHYTLPEVDVVHYCTCSYDYQTNGHLNNPFHDNLLIHE